ncbi:MAG: stage III sporulation protein AF [Defluviitaleaceae bacterium]|nr:stage III sporulation protein AF [Defluviitaleaceae bacterium]
MQSLFAHITNITYYLLLAAAAHMLAPAGKYRKFVSLVTGFVLIAVILSPLRSIGRDFDVADFFNSISAGEAPFSADTGGHEGLRHEWLAAAFDEQLTAQLAHLLAREGIALHEAAFSHNEDFSRILSAELVVSRDSAARVPFIRIEPVQVGRGQAADDDPLATEVKNLVADFYGIPHAHIDVITRRNE